MAKTQLTSNQISDSTITSGDIADNTVINSNLADMLQATLKGRAAAAGTGAPSDLTAAQVKTILSTEIANLIYPVGIVVTLGVSTNPNTLFGVGTWTAIAGQVIVGKAAAGTFVTLNATGGAETHTLASSEMPSHTHTQDSHNHTQDAHSHDVEGRNNSAFGTETKAAKSSSATGGAAVITTGARATTATNQATTATNQNTGGGGAHNNLQPYIVKYVWERTA